MMVPHIICICSWKLKCRKLTYTSLVLDLPTGCMLVSIWIWLDTGLTQIMRVDIVVCSFQARSQDQFWGGVGPLKSGPFWPKKVDFLNITPLPVLQKTHFWPTLWQKVDVLVDLGWCVAPPWQLAWFISISVESVNPRLNQLTWQLPTMHFVLKNTK